MGNETATPSGSVSGFCIESKIDLTSYIKWWGASRDHPAESTSKLADETKRFTDDISSELKILESATQPTEPYQMPQLGNLHGRGNSAPSSNSAMSILSRSTAFRNLQEKVSKQKEIIRENDENENKSNIARLNHGKEIDKSSGPEHENNESITVALAIGEGTSCQRIMYPLGQVLSAPNSSGYNIDPLTDSAIWSSLVPTSSSGLPLASEVSTEFLLENPSLHNIIMLLPSHRAYHLSETLDILSIILTFANAGNQGRGIHILPTA